MPTLHWIGKEKVINHHIDVPYRMMEHSYGFDNGQQTPQPTHSGNKIIHGDNLEALKALLPEYEGRIKCIYIDPPYNTGNEGWVYNDNVNDPKIKKWLEATLRARDNRKEAAIGIDDLARHDKWLCMIYPRLKLLHKLLADDGAIFISIDDNEQANLKLVCDEIFGLNNFVANIIWEKVYSPRMDSKGFSASHDFILAYRKSEQFFPNKLSIAQDDKQFKNWDEKEQKYYRSRSLRKEGATSLRSDRPNLYYPIEAPDGTSVFPIKPDGVEGRWRWSKETYEENLAVGLTEWVRKGDRWDVYVKQWKEDNPSRPPSTLWLSDEVGHNHSAKDQIKKFDLDITFDTPKPSTLIERILQVATDKNSLILDSFSGSGTTAHAVLNLNKQDGGKRKFILVEMETYAETITAERVKRVINGYGDGNKATDGTGGSFDFYELGEPMFLEDGNLNEAVDEARIRQYVYYTETKQPIDESVKKENTAYMGMHNHTAYYFHYVADAVTTLNHDFLATITTKAEQYVIYADNCLLTKEYMAKHHIIFKKIPRDITRF